MKIAVIGGGMQGLSLAYFLSKNPNFSVSLFERNKNLGGLLNLLKINGTGFEGFYHHWANHDTDIIDLAKELGLGDRLLYKKSLVSIFSGGRIYPFSTPSDLLKFSPLSFWDRLRVGFSVLFLRHLKNYKKLENVTAERWFTRVIGRRAYEILWEPLLRGKFGEWKNRIAMSWMWSRISWRAKSRSGAGEQLIYPRYGFGPLIEKMSEKIATAGNRIKTGVSVEAIRSLKEGGVGVTVDGREEIFDKVFVTTPIQVFLRLTKDLPDDYVERLRQIKYRAAHVGVLVMNHSLVTDGYYWVSVNDRDIPLLAVIEHTNLVPKEDYGGKTIVYLGNYPGAEDPIMSLPDEKVFELYSRYLSRINPDFRPEWVEKYHIFKDPAAQPVVTTDYHKFIPPYETPIKNLYLVTMAQIYPDDRGTSNAVRQAKEVIEEVFGV